MAAVAWTRPRWVLLTVGLVGCTSSDPPAPAAKPAKTEPEPPKTLPAPPKAKPEPDPPPEAEPQPEPKDLIADDEPFSYGALLLQGDSLVRMEASGETKPIVKAPGMQQCERDRYHHVVWLASNTKLSTFDFNDGTVHSVVSVPKLPPDDVELVWRVQFFDKSPFPVVTSGSAEGLDDCGALVLALDKPIKLGGAMVAEGDRIYYCAEEEQLGDLDIPNEDTKAEMDVYDEAKLLDKKYVVALRARRTSMPRRTTPLPKAPPAPKIHVDPKTCVEEPDSCGDASYLGGRVWSVVTANDRGDFFYEDRQLYDAKTKSFWDPKSDKRTPKPADMENVGTFPVSPDGTWALFGDKILSLTDAKVSGSFEGTFCGWVDF